MKASAVSHWHEKPAQGQLQPVTRAILAKLYSEARMVGKSGKVFESRTALSTIRNLRDIEHLLRQSRPKNTLEVGMAFGGSSLIFADVGQAVCSDIYRHTMIDPFQNTVWDGIGMQCLELAGLLNVVQLVEESSCLALPRLLAEGRRFELIYVDGSHLFEDAFVDAYFCGRLLTDQGHLLFDDSSNPHIAKVLAFIDTSLPSLQKVPERSWRQRIVRLLGRRQLTVYKLTGPAERPWDSKFYPF